MRLKHEDRFHHLVHQLNALEITRPEMDELKVLMDSIRPKEPKPLDGWVNVYTQQETARTLYPSFESARGALDKNSPAKTVLMREVKEG